MRTCSLEHCEQPSLASIGNNTDSDLCFAHFKWKTEMLTDELAKSKERAERRERKLARRNPLTADDYAAHKIDRNNRKLAERLA